MIGEVDQFKGLDVCRHRHKNVTSAPWADGRIAGGFSIERRCEVADDSSAKVVGEDALW